MIEIVQKHDSDLLLGDQGDVRTKTVDGPGMRDQQMIAIILDDPTHAVAHLNRVWVHVSGVASQADDVLGRVRFSEILFGHESLTAERSVTELEADPLTKIASAGVDRSRRLRFVDVIPGNHF